MPDLIGVNGDRAADLLRSRGFRVSVVGDHPTRACRPASSSARARRAASRSARRSDVARGEPLMKPRAVQIAPSLLSADFARARRRHRGGRTRRRRHDPRRRDGRPLRPEHHDRPAGASSRWRAWRRLPLDVHLMIEDPDATSRRSSRRARRASPSTRRRPCICTAPCTSSRASARRRASRSIPATPVSALEQIAGDLDYVLVMTVNPGFGGQTFIPRSESKVRAVRELLRREGSPRPSRSTAASTRAPRRGSSRPEPTSWSPATPCSGRAIPSAPSASCGPRPVAAAVVANALFDLHASGSLRRNR